MPRAAAASAPEAGGAGERNSQAEYLAPMTTWLSNGEHRITGAIAVAIAVLFLLGVLFTESFITLVASIRSHAVLVSHDYSQARARIGNARATATHYELLFSCLSILTIGALIFCGIGALRAIGAFFFASAVYFVIGGILMQEALLSAAAFTFFGLLAPWLVSLGIHTFIIYALRAIGAFFFALSFLGDFSKFFSIALFTLLASILISPDRMAVVNMLLPKSATPSTLPSSSASPPSSNLKPKRSACTPSEISLF